MIPKLIIISLLAIEHVFTVETSIASRTLPLSSPASAIGITTTRTTLEAKKTNASSSFFVDYPIASSNDPSYQFHHDSRNGDQTENDYILQLHKGESESQVSYPVDDLNYNPVVRYSRKNNHTQLQGDFALDKNTVEFLQQQQQQQIRHQKLNETSKDKSKGIIEFQFDINEGRGEHGSAAGKLNSTASSSLDRILSSLFPQNIADIFRFSYVAEPTNTKGIIYSKENYENRKVTSTPSLLKSFIDRRSLPSSILPPPPSSSVVHATIEEANSTSLVTNEDVRNINGAAEIIKAPQKVPVATELPAQPSYPYGEPINVDNRSDSDYEDHNLNLNEDNLIAPSQEIPKPLFRHPPEVIQIRGGNRDIYKDMPISELEKQINVQIIQDSLGGYGQKLLFSPTRELDEFQEEVEKQFSPNDVGTETEAASRKFLKHFKGHTQPLNSGNQILAQTNIIQPKSLLHTYIYSSLPTEDSVSESIRTDSKSYMEPATDNNSQLKKMSENQLQIKGVNNESPLHTHIYFSGLDGNLSLDSHSSQNKSSQTAPEDQFLISESPLSGRLSEFNERPQTEQQSKPNNRENPLYNPIYSTGFAEDFGNKSDENSPKDQNLFFVHGTDNSQSFMPSAIHNERAQTQPPKKSTHPESSLHKYIHSSELNINSGLDSYSSHSNSNEDKSQFFEHHTDNKFVESPSEANERVANQQQSQSHSQDYSSGFSRDLSFDNYSVDNKSNTTPLNEQIENSYETERDTQASENQQTKQISLLHTEVFSSNTHPNSLATRAPTNEAHGYTYIATPYPQIRYHPRTLVEIQKSVNIHNKFITEKNGNLIEQHEIFTRPEKSHNLYPAVQLVATTTPDSLSEHPIRVAHADESNQSESFVVPESVLEQQPDDQVPKQLKQDQEQYHHQNQEQQQTQEQIYNTVVVEKPVLYPINVEKLVPQPYPVDRLVEKYVDRPVYFDHIVEKEVNMPYPVKEIVEQIVDRPVPVEKIIDRPVHIPYPVRVDHFIDRPYAVQVPIAVAVPVHRYIDRPYPVEKIVEKPIHVPYAVEKVVEKIVEKHIPVEVERVVAKPVENYVEYPYKLKSVVTRPISKKLPIPVEVSMAVALTKNKDSKKIHSAHKTESTILDILELVPPPADGGQSYKTLPENIDILLLDDYNGPVPYESEYLHWNQPIKRGTKGHYIKRSPEFVRNLRMEYGFKPPLVPSLEIDDQGLPLVDKKNGD